MTASLIRLLNWNDYTAPAVLARFAAETGIAVEEVFVERNEDYIDRVTAGEVFDVIMPTDWAAAALANAGLLQPLDMERLPNWRHVTQPSFQHPPYDIGVGDQKYTSVYMFGTEGFAVALDKVEKPRRSWEMLYDPTYAGQIAMVDGSREVLAPALFLLGAGPNTTDRETIERATQMAIEQRRLVLAYDAQDVMRRIVDGVPLVHCWDGDVAAALTRGATGIRYMLPREGYRLWADAPCIPANAPDPDAAHRLLDFLLQPDVAAQNADFAGYQPVVPAAEPLIRSLVQRVVRPTDEQIAVGTFLRDLGEFNAVYEAAYQRVRAGG